MAENVQARGVSSNGSPATMDRRKTAAGRSSGRASRPKEAERLRQAEMLLDLSKRVADVESLDEILEILVEMTTWEVGAERGTLFLNDPQTGGSIGEIRLPNHLGIAGTVFTTGQTVNIPQAYADLRFNPAFDKKTRLRGTYRIRDIDEVIVKGKTEPVRIYEVLDYHTDESFPNLMEAVNLFREGRKQYRAGNWKKAIKRFNDALKLNPCDRLSRNYVERCEHLQATPPDDWRSVWVVTSK